MNTSTFDPSGYLKTLPNRPGVYRFLDSNHQVLYVGKAVSLKKRVSSYFQKTDLSPRIALMVKQIAAIEVTITRSETEALILENNFIKSLNPKYNILFRDDKSYPYLMISGHTYPQMAYYRGSLKKPNQYFGPYPNGYAVRDSIQILQKVFLLRTCEDSVFEHRDRACLLWQIRRCSAPCVGHISQEDYAESVAEAITFLNGKTTELMHDINHKMQTAAEALDFEAAARYRDQIQALNKVQSQQFIDSNNPNSRHNIDIIALAQHHDQICLHRVSIRQGRRVGEKSHFPDSRYLIDSEASEIGAAFVAQFYLDNPIKPDILITNFRLPESLQTALNEEMGKTIQFISQTKGERKVWLNMAEENARLAISQKEQQNQSQEARVRALAELIGINLSELNRIECFDISHTQGEATIASCVVYQERAMQPSQYRRYTIKTAKAGDDYAAMREVLTRRYGKLAEGNEEDGTWPDLVLIDGGKGQIRIAQEVWQEFGIHIPLIGVAKGPERKAGLEELIIPHQNATMQLPPHSPALHLLQTVRDESHRFAITGHRRARNKARFASPLTDIAGIGPKRRKNLLTRFGGLRGLQAASIDDIAQTDGISYELAEKIHAALHH